MLSTPLRLIGVGLIAILGFVLFLGTYYTVENYERGVLTRFGAVVAVEGPGLHFKAPFVNSVVFYRTDIQDVSPKQQVNTYTIDNQEVDVSFNLFYRIPVDRVEYVYTNVQDYKVRLEAMAIDRLKAAMGNVNVAHVAEKRGELRDRIKNVLAGDAGNLGIEVTDFQLTNLDYTKSFKTAVEGAAAAKAGVETREQELQQALKTADRQRAEARGLADSNLLVAEAAAKATELKGKAEAAAIEAQAKALASNAALVDLRKAEKWDGRLPTSMLSNVMPFLNVDQKVSGGPVANR